MNIDDVVLTDTTLAKVKALLPKLPISVLQHKVEVDAFVVGEVLVVNSKTGSMASPFRVCFPDEEAYSPKFEKRKWLPLKTMSVQEFYDLCKPFAKSETIENAKNASTVNLYEIEGELKLDGLKVRYLSLQWTRDRGLR